MDYNHSLNLNPNNAIVYNDQNVTKRKLWNNYGELSDYYNAIQMDPKYVVAYYNRG